MTVVSTIKNWDTTWGIPLWRANIVAQINPAPAAGVGVKSAGRKGALLFACHLDTVGPASNPPFAGIESEGKIYGRLPVLRQGLRLDERPDEQ
ncbi:hypothetical protein ES703_117406 [subsurface metagenome]